MSKVLTSKEAFQALLDGKKIKAIEMDTVYFLDENGGLICQGEQLSGDIFRDYQMKIYEEPEEKPLMNGWFGSAQITVDDNMFYMRLNCNDSCEWRKALGTFMQLKTYPLARKVILGRDQYIIRPLTNTLKDTYIEGGYSFIFKLNNLSPCFSSKEDAQKAIDAIGEENIINMFKVFGGVE